MTQWERVFYTNALAIPPTIVLYYATGENEQMMKDEEGAMFYLLFELRRGRVAISRQRLEVSIRHHGDDVYARGCHQQDGHDRVYHHRMAERFLGGEDARALGLGRVRGLLYTGGADDTSPGRRRERALDSTTSRDRRARCRRVAKYSM